MISGGIGHAQNYEKAVGGTKHAPGQISMDCIIRHGGTWKKESLGWSGKAGRTI